MSALKVVLLGDSAVGKSSLLHRFTSNSFDSHLPNTIGAAFISTNHSSNERSVKLEIWDTAGQERYRSLTPMYYRNGKVALVCFDMSAAQTSFEKARYWLDQLKLSGPQDIVVKVVGTKSDLVHVTQAKSSESRSDTDGSEIDKSNGSDIDKFNGSDIDKSNGSDIDKSNDSDIDKSNGSNIDKSNGSDIDKSNDSALVDIERYCLEHDFSFYRTSAKTNSGIIQIFDDIVNEVDEDFFKEPSPPRITLHEPPSTKCC